MILVTGATGTIGSELMRQLVARGIPVRGMTRKPHESFMQGDFDDPESLRKAIDGVDTVFLLTAPGPWVPAHDRALVAAALDGGVRKIVKLSAIGTTDDGALDDRTLDDRATGNGTRGDDTPSGSTPGDGTPGDGTPGDGTPGNWHAVGERAVRESGLEWTILRPAGFASNVLRWLPAVRNGQPIPNQTGVGRHAFVDPRDVAEVAAEALLSDEHGQTYTLTGPELLSVPEQVAVLSDILGSTLSVVDVPLEVYAEQLRSAGLDEAVVSVALRGAELIRSGGEQTVTDDVERVLGRPARTFREWARAYFG